MMKAIRLQIDMLYQVDEEHFQKIYEHDVEFFNAMAKEFNTWGSNENEKRVPVSFDFRHGVGDVKAEEEE